MNCFFFPNSGESSTFTGERRLKNDPIFRLNKLYIETFEAISIAFFNYRALGATDELSSHIGCIFFALIKYFSSQFSINIKNSIK